MSEAFICEGVRTPIGRHGGALAAVRPDDLAAHVIRALTGRSPGLDPLQIDEVILGCANQAGEDNRNVARMAGLLGGLPREVPGTTVNRLCASGAEAIAIAARAIRAGEAALILAGGVESMSRAPYVLGKAESAFGRAQTLEDTTIGWRFVNKAMVKLYGTASMPETGENVAERMQVSREDQDRFAERSQARTAAAQARGYHAAEIAPVTIAERKGERIVETDEHPRADTSFEVLQKLKPIVRPDGTVTAGNASGVNDGAAALWIASREAADAHGLTPRARILGAATAGVAPDVMGIGPVPATRKLLDRLGLSIADFDLIEINEAFASQVIASMRALGVDPMDEIVNPNGGAIALGHPLGMSGARLALTAAHMLQESGARRALVTMCVGVGQGLALALERA
jgi:3-oxoadipyl-CoA thiolase